VADLECDLAIIGGGLAGGLIALAFAERRPGTRILLIEQADHVGGNHIWSFFDGDVDARDRWLVDPLVSSRWSQGHEVRFPGYRRLLNTPYNSIASPRFDAHVRAALGDRLLTGAQVATIGRQFLVLEMRGARATCRRCAVAGRNSSGRRCDWHSRMGSRGR
jgi:lycopene beta-cyclase